MSLKFQSVKKCILLFLILSACVGRIHSQCSTSSAPTNNCGAGDYIDSFVLNGIAATGNAGCSGASGYSFFPTPVWNLQIGNTYTWSAACSGGIWSEGIAIWIDLNNDGFYTSSEMVVSTSPSTLHVSSFTIPFSATIANNVKMRVRDFWNTTIANTEMCTNGTTSQWGETEDHYINIVCPAALASLSVAASSTLVCLGEPATFTASGAGSFTFAGGSASISNAVTFTPAASQAYTITGSINGCPAATSSVVSTISVTSIPAPVVASITPSIICSGNTATISASGANSFTYLPGPSILTGPNPTIAVSSVAATIYTVRGYNGNGCPGTVTLALAVNPLPTLTVVGSSPSVCAGTSVSLMASGALQYSWQPGGSGPSIIHSPTITTAYLVTGTNNFNCSASISTVIIVSSSPSIVAVTNYTTVCSGGNSTLIASGAPSLSWVGGPSTASYVVSPASASVYTVIGTNTAGCQGSQTIAVNVMQVQLNISATPTVLCSGQTVSFSVNGTNSYSLSPPTQTPQVTTLYTLSVLTSSNGLNCANSNTFLLTVNPVPTLTASATKTVICRNEKTTLNVSGAANYLWYTSTNPTLATTPSVSLTLTTTATYSYYVTGTCSLGCTNSATVLVKVNGCTALEETGLLQTAMELYPNPNTGEFTLKSGIGGHILILNAQAKVVDDFYILPGAEQKIELRNKTTGMYFVVLEVGGATTTRKIVVIH